MIMGHDTLGHLEVLYNLFFYLRISICPYTENILSYLVFFYLPSTVILLTDPSTFYSFCLIYNKRR